MRRPSNSVAGACTSRDLQRGMTLVELMVAMGIGLGVTLAITSLLITSENHKRTTTSTNDAEQTGAYTFHALDGWLRSAGSSVAESATPSDRGVLACKLNANLAGGAILPRAGAFPAPFNSTALTAAVAGNLRVAPLLIGRNMSPDGLSDVLVIMGGSGAAGGVSRQVTGVGSSTSLTLDNSVGFAVGDLAIVSQNGTTDCLLEQVAAPIALPTVTLGGSYYTAGTTTTIGTLATSTTSYLTPLGNVGTPGASNVQFQMIGVGANNTLYNYDLLQLNGVDAAQAIADGVVQLHAIYGVDSDGDGVQDTWAGPGDTGTPDYTLAGVMTHSGTMANILAVRVAVVVRGQYADKKTVSPASLTLFTGYTNLANTSLAIPVTLDPNYRYRVFEFTVPLRNMLLLAAALH